MTILNTQFSVKGISFLNSVMVSYYVDAVQDTDAKVHERFGEIDDLLPL